MSEKEGKVIDPSKNRHIRLKHQRHRLCGQGGQLIPGVPSVSRGVGMGIYSRCDLGHSGTIRNPERPQQADRMTWLLRKVAYGPIASIIEENGIHRLAIISSRPETTVRLRPANRSSSSDPSLSARQSTALSCGPVPAIARRPAQPGPLPQSVDCSYD
jgi:hypothetical protein